MVLTPKSLIAIDIDDVIADTSEAIRLWANQQAGVSLTKEDYLLSDGGYWNYYEAIWERHGIADVLSFGDFLDSMDEEQGHIAPIKDAQRVITKLKKKYDIVFITARRPQHKGSTRRWLDEHMSTDIPLFLSHNPFANEAAQSKGELCRELGVEVLIDDNSDNCQSALDYDVRTILFGTYGWSKSASSHMTRCVSWREVEEYLDARE